MAFVPGYKARILIGDTSWSAKLHTFSGPFNVDMHECSTFADAGSRRYTPGQNSSSLSAGGYMDATVASEISGWSSTQPLTFAFDGLALSTNVWMLNALMANFTPKSPVGGVSGFDLTAQTDGFTDLGVSLHDLTASTSDTNFSSHDGGAASSGGAVGHIHVTEYSGLTQAVFKIQHSTDNFSANTADLITFSTVTGVTGEHAEVTGTVNRYLRATIDVTGTGTVTFAVACARR